MPISNSGPLVKVKEATDFLGRVAKGVIGISDDAARFAAQSPRADHAMRHLIDQGIINGTNAKR